MSCRREQLPISSFKRAKDEGLSKTACLRYSNIRNFARAREPRRHATPGTSCLRENFHSRHFRPLKRFARGMNGSNIENVTDRRRNREWSGLFSRTSRAPRSRPSPSVILIGFETQNIRYFFVACLKLSSEMSGGKY